MAQRSIDNLGELQRAIMESLWAHGEQTVQEVRERLTRRRDLAYTTILSAMQKLERLGWVTHREEGRAYVYSAAQTRQQEGRSAVRSFVQRVFRGDRMAAFQHLLEDRSLTDTELAELKRLIGQRRKDRNNE